MDVMGMRAGGYLRVLGVGEGGGVQAASTDTLRFLAITSCSPSV
jgi:hypothetical protein